MARDRPPATDPVAAGGRQPRRHGPQASWSPSADDRTVASGDRDGSDTDAGGAPSASANADTGDGAAAIIPAGASAWEPVLSSEASQLMGAMPRTAPGTPAASGDQHDGTQDGDTPTAATKAPDRTQAATRWDPATAWRNAGIQGVGLAILVWIPLSEGIVAAILAAGLMLPPLFAALAWALGGEMGRAVKEALGLFAAWIGAGGLLIALAIGAIVTDTLALMGIWPLAILISIIVLGNKSLQSQRPHLEAAVSTLITTSMMATSLSVQLLLG